MSFPEGLPADTERELYLRRFSEMGILFQIRTTAAHQVPIDDDTIDAMTVLPAWFHIEHKPDSGRRNIEEVLGEGAHIPQLVFDCTWPAIGGGRLAYCLSVFDEELQLDAGQVELIESWASERNPLVYRY